MKRTSILATMLATALLGVAALGAGSASADVLCKDVSFSYNCPAEDTYGVGTEFYAWEYGTVKLDGGTAGNLNLVTCADSELDMVVTNAGGPFNMAYPEVDVANFSFANCGDDSISVVNDGTGVISQYSPASQKGSFIPLDLQIKATTNWVYKEEPAECTYKVVGRPVIVGAKTEALSVSKLRFTETLAELVNSSGIGCTTKARVTGEYNFPYQLNFGADEGIYVLPQ